MVERRTSPYNRIILGVLLFIVAACRNDDRAWSSADSWFNPPPEKTNTRNWTAVQNTFVHPIVPDKMKMVDSLLCSQQFVEVSDSDASSLICSPLTIPPHYKTYLIRAVFLGNPKNGFSVQISQDSVLVVHGSLGHTSAPMMRYGLIVLLQQKPSIVFHMCYRDE